MKMPATRTKILAATIATAALVGVGASSAFAAGENTPAAPSAAAAAEAVVQANSLSIDGATKAAQAAMDAAEKAGQRVSVAVVDRNGVTRVLLKGDGSGPQSAESAERKAYTAAAWNAPTSELAGRVSDENRLQDIPGTLFLAGAVPVDANKAPIAGIGVAGAPSGDQDEEFAKAGLDAIASELN